MIKLAVHLFKNHKEYRLIYTQEYVHLIGMGALKKKLGWEFEIVYCEGFVSNAETRIRYADSLQEINVSNYDFIAPKASQLGVPVKLIPHFFDPIWDTGEVDTELLDSIVKFKGVARLLIYVGPTDLAEKNFGRIEEFMLSVASGWKLLICGSAGEETMERLNAHGVDKVKSVYVSHAMMQRIYPLADIFVLPSTHEAFGIATIEAMGHGLPVLLHDSPHSRWLCNDDRQCIDMTRSQAISDYLLSIEDVDLHIEAKGFANQQYFLKTFTWEHLKDDYLALFKI